MIVASELLLDLSSRYGGEGSTLVLGGEADLANNLAGDVLFSPTDVRERDASRVPVLHTAAEHAAGTVLIPAPPDRDLLRRQLIVASRNIAESGRILICGPNAAGGRSAIKDAEALLGPPFWSGYREKHRMAIFTSRAPLEPTWSTEPGIAPGTWREFQVNAMDQNLTLHTQVGVFAGAKLDAGTKLLLEHLKITPELKVLDIGCGVGVIGILAAMNGGNITMTDANLLAVQAAAHNVEDLGIRAEVLASDVYHHLDDRRFDLIVSNPPFHRGKQVDYTVANEIIRGAASRLNPGGELIIVANAFLAYGKQMANVFTRVDSIAKTPQYHVLLGAMS